MAGPEDSRESAKPDPVGVATYLWEEYRYRHDMVWKLVFRITAVATALLIAPFLADRKTQEILGGWLVFLPALAVLIVLLGLFTLPPELELLRHVKAAYRCEQDRALGHLGGECYTAHSLRPSENRRGLRRLLSDRFPERVVLFLCLMLVATAVFLGVFLAEWLPKISRDSGAM